MTWSTTQGRGFRRSGMLVIIVAAIIAQVSDVAYSDWAWIDGSNARDEAGYYGTKGVPGHNNGPGAREGSVSWIDGSGNLWLFGGSGRDSTGSSGFLNDLWKFDGANWTWVSGSEFTNGSGVYGTKGVANPANVPGARDGSVSWTDGGGNLWLFGGSGFDSTGSLSRLNDLWKFDGTNWTWVGGSKTIDQAGVYGTKGVADPANVPGARYSGVSWIDSSGNLWLFGGWGFDSSGTGNYLNDLWRFDGTSWTWVSGSNTGNQTGVYGTKGVAHSANVPGARWGSVSWADSSGSLWLFGGFGYDSTGSLNHLNDLWKFDGTNWTWVSGSSTTNQAGVYGTKGVPDPANVPGARWLCISWTGSSGNLWLFGGEGRDSTGSSGYLNDLWKFDGTNWTWVGGSKLRNESPVYGTQGVRDPANVPGGRKRSISWTDKSGSLWLLGGYGYDSIGSLGRLNDLWRFDGSSKRWALADGLPDFDGDGTTDLLWHRTSTGAYFVTLMSGGVPGTYQYVGGGGDPDIGIVGLGDCNGDGQTDLLWRRTSTSAHFVTISGEPPGSYHYVGGGGDPDLEIIGLGDCDGSGTTDLLWRRTSTSAHFVTLMTGGVPGPYQYIGGGGDPDLGIVGLGDCDGGGTTDLLWRRTSTSAYFVTLMTGGVPGAYQYAGGGGDPDLEIIGLGDCDGNGTTDLLWQRTSTSANFVTLMTGGVPGAYQYVGGGGDPDFWITWLGDCDGSGTTDLLWYRTSTSANFVTLMTGGVPGSYQYVGGGGDPDLTISGLGDCDGNGTTDLLWRRASTSASFVTLMTGGVPGAYKYVGGGGDPDLWIVELE
ncbi:MAG: hypothetical protein JSU70_11335 [Phycisphaerales bacterium]|nr:MAG: hypothetical protein JSU70_11335 [Phycisphaerales bacterium]